MSESHIDMQTPLIEAVQTAGGNVDLAAMLNAVELPLPPTTRKTGYHVSTWKRRGKCPADQVLRIEAVTGVSRHLLRPDVFGYSPIPAPGERAEQPREAAE